MTKIVIKSLSIETVNAYAQPRTKWERVYDNRVWLTIQAIVFAIPPVLLALWFRAIAESTHSHPLPSLLAGAMLMGMWILMAGYCLIETAFRKDRLVSEVEDNNAAVLAKYENIAP